MKISTLLSSAAILAFLGSAPAALAGSSDDVHGVEQAKMSLGDAIGAAQKQSGGKAIFAKYETRNGAGNYIVVLVDNGRKDTMSVDPQTGQATKADQASSGSSSEAGAQTIENARVGLSEAIASAERKDGGRAMRATLDTEKGRTAYKVELAKGDNTDTVWVDASSGQIIEKSM